MKDIEDAAKRGDLNSEELRRRAVKLINEVADDAKATRREKLSAGKALLSVAKVQEQIESNKPAKSGRARAVELAEQLGLTHALAAVPGGDSAAGYSFNKPTQADSSGAGRDQETGDKERGQSDSDSSSQGLEPPGAEP